MSRGIIWGVNSGVPIQLLLFDVVEGYEGWGEVGSYGLDGDGSLFGGFVRGHKICIPFWAVIAVVVV